MLALFLNPGFLFIAGALVSVPIIIHLINRMRFKRIRWAAMEFLIKAQKRTRRRLIIEQLILLALRCFLIALVGLLVSRFIGCGESNLTGKPNLHLVLLDDTLSMQDQWKHEGANKNAFDVAKVDMLEKKIAKGLSLSKTNDRLMIVPLSKIKDSEFKPKSYERLGDKQKLDETKRDITELQPSMMHVSMLEGIKYAKRIIGDNIENPVTLHVIGDLRQPDWGGSDGEKVKKELLDLVKDHRDNVKVRIIDTVHPQRAAAQGGYPPSRDSVGIVDVRPSTRIAGKNMPVMFTVSVHNFSGKYVEAMLVARDETTGKDMREVNYNPQNPIKLPPATTTNVTFLHRFAPEIKGNESHFAHLSLRLTNLQLGQLDNDGLLGDNIRHTVVEVREKVPILVIDGEGAKGREEGKDSFHVAHGLISVPGASYQVVYGHELAGGNPAKALERSDLHQYPTIFMLNVPKLTPKQLTNLENYVRDGGGVAFYMGPLVDTDFYNKSLYKGGKGIFPAPLRSTYFPKPGDPDLPEQPGDTYQLLIRDEKFGDPKRTPIFGAVFEEPKQRELLRNLPIKRYFQVHRSAWKPDPDRVKELATLPNDASTAAYVETVVNIRDGDTLKAIRANEKLAKYLGPLNQHLDGIFDLVRPGNVAKAYHLANLIDDLLKDKGMRQGKELTADLSEFWANSDAHVQALLVELRGLREQVNYGDPFVLTNNYKKGKVVAVLSTAGKDWNSWAGGSPATILFPAFIWEMQNYLSSPGSEGNLAVGSTVDVELDAEQFKGSQLKMVRWFLKPSNEAPSERVPLGEQFQREAGGQLVFTLTKNLTPGLYVSELIDETVGAKPIATYGHAFNVETMHEGQLKRVGSDELDKDLIAKSDGAIRLVGPNTPDGDLVGRVEDFSESPWLFLIFLIILVVEQALAVHLSFHMKNNEDALPGAGSTARAV